MTPLLCLAFLTTPSAPSEDFSKTWDDVSKAISTRYYARKTRHDEMQSLLAKYAPLAKAAKSRADFENTVDTMIHEFRDSHFDFLTTDDQGYYVMDGLTRKEAATMPFFGAWFRKGVDGYTVQMVLNESEAEKQDLRKGDVVLQVDGQPFSPVASLDGKQGKLVDLLVRRNGRAISKHVSVSSTAVLDAFLESSRESARIIERNGRHIGYFHLWTLANDSFRSALAGAVTGKLKDTDAFILDLREGYGGRPEGFGDPFFRPDVTTTWDYGESKPAEIHFGYQRPLIVIINEGSRSAKELLSYIFKRSHRATLVGSNTAGAVLGTWPYKVNDWSYLEIPMVEVKANGERLEGKGVAPDVPVIPEFDANGKDLFLERALQLVEKVKTYQKRAG